MKVDLDDILERMSKGLDSREPAPGGGFRFAAVSVIVDDRTAPMVLLIRRADRAGDPWSGQIAFPGGKMQAGDRTARETAVRETKEEVGFDLSGASRFLGYGKVTPTHTGTMEVVPVVFQLQNDVVVRQNEEVASYRWVGLADLFAPGARSTYTLNYGGNAVELPALAAGDYVVWGLTHRILSSLISPG